ncbi:hypothetical protein ACP70R_036608 [Stipagrostis hirtigluma subsp. patula]
MHVHIQQPNGRKSLTTVQGLKKEYNCNGMVVQDPELGQVIQLQGYYLLTGVNNPDNLFSP